MRRINSLTLEVHVGVELVFITKHWSLGGFQVRYNVILLNQDIKGIR